MMRVSRESNQPVWAGRGLRVRVNLLIFKDFLLEMKASELGLGTVLSEKQTDSQYHPVAYATSIPNYS